MTVEEQMEKELATGAGADVQQAMRNVDSGDRAIDQHKAVLSGTKPMSSAPSFADKPRVKHGRSIDEVYKASESHANLAHDYKNRIKAIEIDNDRIMAEIGNLLEQHSKNVSDIALLSVLGASQHVAQKIVTVGAKAIVEGVTRTK